MGMKCDNIFDSVYFIVYLRLNIKRIVNGWLSAAWN